MLIGDLDKRIIIKEPVDVPDGQGGRKNDWVTKYTVWASIKAPRTNTAVVKGAVSSEMTHEITIRKKDDVVAGYKVFHKKHEYDVLHSYEDFYNGTVLQCREIIKRS